MTEKVGQRIVREKMTGVEWIEKETKIELREHQGDHAQEIINKGESKKIDERKGGDES